MDYLWIITFDSPSKSRKKTTNFSRPFLRSPRRVVHGLESRTFSIIEKVKQERKKGKKFDMWTDKVGKQFCWCRLIVWVRITRYECFNAISVIVVGSWTSEEWGVLLEKHYSSDSWVSLTWKARSPHQKFYFYTTIMSLINFRTRNESDSFSYFRLSLFLSSFLLLGSHLPEIRIWLKLIDCL